MQDCTFEYISRVFPDYPGGFNLVYENGWYDWEEYFTQFIFEQDQKYYSITAGHCVMVSDQDASWSQLEPISEEEAIELMIETDNGMENPNWM